MSTSRKAPRPVEALIRGETANELLTVMAIQVDHLMGVVEAMAALLLNVLSAGLDKTLEEEGNADNEEADKRMEAAARASMDRLAAALGGVA